MSVSQSHVIDPPAQGATSIVWPDGLNRDAGHLEVRKPHVVKEFLEENAFLIPLIEESQAKIAEYFGPETLLVLEVRFHPDDGLSELFLYIKSPLPVSEAMGILDRLAWDWWLDEMPRARNRMMINLIASTTESNYVGAFHPGARPYAALYGFFR